MDYRDSYAYDQEHNQKKLDKYAQMLCTACKTLEKLGQEVPENVKEWWLQHKLEDARREAAEKELQRQKNLKANALAKLTDEERKILGL
jgi:hypothetical protein